MITLCNTMFTNEKYEIIANYLQRRYDGLRGVKKYEKNGSICLIIPINKKKKFGVYIGNETDGYIDDKFLVLPPDDINDIIYKINQYLINNG